MYLSSNESRSLFIETAAFLPLLMLPSLLSIISSGDDGSESFLGDSAAWATAGLLNQASRARAGGAALLMPDYHFLTERSELVLRKLEAAAAVAPSAASAAALAHSFEDDSLSLGELRAALEELRQYGPAFELQAKQALPRLHLLADLLGAMELSNALAAGAGAGVGETSLGPNTHSQAQRFIGRLVKQYKLMRSLYLTRRHLFAEKSADEQGEEEEEEEEKKANEEDNENNKKVRTKKTSAAIRALLALKDHKPLSNKLLAEALAEYIGCLQAFNQLGGQINSLDAKQQELFGQRLNYLNSVEVRLLGLHVFSKLHLLSGQEELEELKKTYKRELFKSGFIVEAGELRVVGGLVEPPANSCNRCD